MEEGENEESETANTHTNEITVPLGRCAASEGNFKRMAVFFFPGNFVNTNKKRSAFNFSQSLMHAICLNMTSILNYHFHFLNARYRIQINVQNDVLIELQDERNWWYDKSKCHDV